ncbi:helix-turn-helix domain-containing protein [Allorhizobium undicola]|uniref:helix-turn-helix domain-containing protein n=1 Tax=Allorhizobium undicola TaxID=78527 RepID=UPI000486BF5F|nr:helix-turn-helix transcriptional regulator [Allorhizobium undicola]
MQDGFMEAMGQRLGKIRKDSGLKQVPFSEALEVSQSAYNTYERGNREIPAKLLRLLHVKFNVNPAWMLTGEGSPYNRDTVDLYHQVTGAVDAFIARENCQVEPDKRLKLIRFLIDYAEQHGEFTEEIAEKYLRSAI